MDPEPAATQVQALGGDVTTQLDYEQFLRAQDEQLTAPTLFDLVGEREGA